MRNKMLFAIVVLLSVSNSIFAASKKKKGHINLPKATNTAPNNWSVHEDLNFYGDQPVAVSSTTIDYGISDNWDIGVSVNNIPLERSISDDYDISVLCNIERNFNLTPQFSVLAGTSVGSDLVPSAINSGIDIYSYLNSSITLWSMTLNAGGYYANSWFAGFNTLGFTAGITLPINKVWSFQFDYISGTNNLSGPTYQIFYKLNNELALGLGVQNQYSNREELMSGIVSLYYR